ncbi:MAG: beta-galactosidase [Candidatus Hydrogenedentota bacterium]
MKSIIFVICSIFFFLSPLCAFFPRGIYTSNYTTFDTLALMGFNLVIGPGSDTDLYWAKKYDFKVIPNIFFDKTSDNQGSLNYIKNKSNDTAILAWYPFDEPDIYNVSYDTYALWRKQIKAIDKNKPIYLTIYTPQQYQRFAELTDIFAIDPYPVISKTDDNKNQLERVYQQVRYARTICKNKPLYTIIQCFYQMPWWEREPEPKELHNMVYQALIGGSDGILYYTFATNSPENYWDIYKRQDILTELKRINKELITLEPVLLKGKNEHNIAFNLNVSELLYCIKNYKGTYYLFVANPFKNNKTLELSFNIEVKNYKTLFDSESVSVKLKNGFIFSINLGKYDYLIMIINQ